MKGKATRLDQDFEVPDEWKSYPRGRDWAEVSIEKQAANFADYHVSRGTKFAVWQRAWQLWCRNAEDFKHVEYGIKRGKLVPVGRNMTAEQLDEFWLDQFGVERPK